MSDEESGIRNQESELQQQGEIDAPDHTRDINPLSSKVQGFQPYQGRAHDEKKPNESEKTAREENMEQLMHAVVALSENC